MITNENSLLVTLHVSQWGAYKKDKQATLDTEQKYGAEHGSVSTTKKLLPKMILKPIKNIITDYKTYFSDNTLPYNLLMGSRILPTENYFDFKAKQEETIHKLTDEVQVFKAGYDDAIAQARITLDDLFDINDYPKKEDLDHKFKITVDYSPIPEAKHFNENISNQVVADLNQHMANVSNSVVLDLISRAEKVVTNLHNILVTEAKRIFQSTTSGNIEKLINQMENLNYNNNTDIAALRQRIKEELSDIRIDYIKTSEVYREKLKTKTTQLLTEIAICYDKYSI